MNVIINGVTLTTADVASVARNMTRVELAPEAKQRVAAARAMVEELIEQGAVVYGITTGFGKFSDVAITKEQVKDLQRNLIYSHACAVGDPLPTDVVRAIMLLRANALAKGHSGVRVETLELLLDMLNRGVHPVVPEQGSLGASGDLAPLAHVVLTMLGEGKAEFEGQILDSREALRRAELEPIELEAKEGLALINGTQAMTAIGALLVEDAKTLLATANRAAALTVEGLRGIPKAYDEKVHKVRNHPGQAKVARILQELLEGSQLTTNPGELRVQDAYALRCIPQVHGASLDALDYVAAVVERELNAATDNPLIFAEQGEVISAGNFHGQPIALALDFLGIALAEMANISERRIERLVNPQLSGLPAFLTEEGGLNSGFMIAQYTAASLVSENKVWAHPASVDSIPSSANQEDHVSMGTTAARKARKICDNLNYVLAIELLCAAQAVEFRQPDKLAPGTRAVYQRVRDLVDRLTHDRILHDDIEKVAAAVRSGMFI